MGDALKMGCAAVALASLLSATSMVAGSARALPASSIQAEIVSIAPAAAAGDDEASEATAIESIAGFWKPVHAIWLDGTSTDEVEFDEAYYKRSYTGLDVSADGSACLYFMSCREWLQLYESDGLIDAASRLGEASLEPLYGTDGSPIAIKLYSSWLGEIKFERAMRPDNIDIYSCDAV